MQILVTDADGNTVDDLTHLEDDSGVGPHVTVVEKGQPLKVEELKPPVGVDCSMATLMAEIAPDLPMTTLAGTDVADVQPANEDKVRPSLDVAIETLGHLRPRIEALCLRMLGWDKREMNPELRAAFEDSVARFEANAATLATALELLRNKGFVAKTTDKTRKLAKMKPGTRVVLDASLAPDFAAVYSPEELDALEVVRTVGSKVFLRTGTREVGLVDVSKVEVRS
jgi:hypothetical protein